MGIIEISCGLSLFVVFKNFYKVHEYHFASMLNG